MVPAVPIRFGPLYSAQFWLLFQVHGPTTKGGTSSCNSVFPPHTEGSANLTVLSGPALCALIDHSLPHVCPVSPVVSRPNPCLSFEFMPGPHSLLARKNKPLQTFFFEKLCIIPAAGSASVLELACMSHVHGLPSSIRHCDWWCLHVPLTFT